MATAGPTGKPRRVASEPAIFGSTDHLVAANYHIGSLLLRFLRNIFKNRDLKNEAPQSLHPLTAKALKSHNGQSSGTVHPRLASR